MTSLNDEFYSNLVAFYQDLNDDKINKFNARLILLLLNEVEDKEKLHNLFKVMSEYKKHLID